MTINILIIEEDYGTLEGYTVNFKDENYKNYIKNEISDNRIANEIISFIKNKQYDEILVIKNLNVYEGEQGNGYGRVLLERGLEGCSAAILISDKYEGQREDFILDKFYEGSHFERITDGYSGSFMAFPADDFINLKQDILKLSQIKNKKNKLKM